MTKDDGRLSHPAIPDVDHTALQGLIPRLDSIRQKKCSPCVTTPEHLGSFLLSVTNEAVHFSGKIPDSPTGVFEDPGAHDQGCDGGEPPSNRGEQTCASR